MFWVALILALGCDGGSSTDDEPIVDSGVSPDSGTDPSCDRGGEEPAAPAAAAEVVFDCPPGWSPLDGACTPWPNGAQENCQSGEFHFPGTLGCRPLGTECPIDADFSEPPADYAGWDRVYVNPSAPPGGDGSSPELALASFRDARVMVRERGVPAVIMLSAGEHVSNQAVGLPADSFTWGACVQMTTIRTSTGTQPDLIMGAIEGWSGLGNVTVSGDTRGVAAGGAGIELHLEGVRIINTIRFGLLAQDGARITGGRVSIESVNADGPTARSLAISVLDSTVELSQVNLQYAAAGVGVASQAGAPSRARIEDAVIANCFDSGAIVFVDGELVLHRSVVEANEGYGIFNLDGNLALEDTIVRDTIYKDDEAHGEGIVATDSADRSGARSRISLLRVLVENNERNGIWLDGRGQTLTATQAIIRDTKAHFVNTSTSGSRDGLDGSGLGMNLEQDSEVWLNQVLLENSRIGGIYAFGPNAKLNGTDVIVRDVGPGLERLDGTGLIIEGASQVGLTRLLVERAKGAAITVTERSLAIFDDLTVRDSAVETFGDGGAGLVVAHPGTRAFVNRGLLERNELYGIIVQQFGSLELTDVRVAETKPLASNGIFGLGLAVNEGGNVTGRRFSLDRNHAAAIVLRNESGLDVEDLLVADTEPAMSAFEPSVQRGLSMEIGSTATIARARFSNNGMVGALVTDDSRLVLRDSAIVGHAGLEGMSGRGLQSQQGARVDLEAVCLDQNREVGLLASAAEIFGRGVLVSGTGHNACFDDGTCDVPGGIGLYSAIGGKIALSGFQLSRNVETGLTIAGADGSIPLPPGQIDLIDGTVEYSVLGADVRDPSFDIGRITTTVVYSNNETNGVEARNTPLPSTDTSGLY